MMILQEIYRDDPWKMLVGCILLNQTSRAQVDGVRDRLFEVYPTPLDMQRAEVHALEEIIRPLGFQKRRARTLMRFSVDWYDAARMPDDGAWPSFKQVEAMYGIGKYALDSYEIFVLGRDPLPEDVDDKVLKAYLELRRVV